MCSTAMFVRVFELYWRLPWTTLGVKWPPFGYEIVLSDDSVYSSVFSLAEGMYGMDSLSAFWRIALASMGDLPGSNQGGYGYTQNCVGSSKLTWKWRGASSKTTIL